MRKTFEVPPADTLGELAEWLADALKVHGWKGPDMYAEVEFGMEGKRYLLRLTELNKVKK